MFYVYLVLVAGLAALTIKNMFQEKNFLMQLSYALLAVPLVLRFLAVK